MYMEIINDTNITQLQRAVTLLVDWVHGVAAKYFCWQML